MYNCKNCKIEDNWEKELSKVEWVLFTTELAERKKWWWYVNRVDSTLDNINPEVTSPQNDGVSCLRFETKKSVCYSSMGITLSTEILGFWACQSLDLGSKSSTWRFKNLWPHVMRTTTHVHTGNLCCLPGIVMRVLCNSLLCCCGGCDEDICHKSCW